MKTLELEYYNIFRRQVSRSFQVPGSWEELTPEQFLLITDNSNGAVSDVDFIAKISGVSKKLIRRMDPYQRFCIITDLDFMEKLSPLSFFIIPSVFSLQAPAAKLEGFQFSQFIFVDSYFELALQNEDTAALDKFVSCLYLPNGESFNEKLIPVRSAYVKAVISSQTKAAILLNYRLVRQWIAERYPLIFLQQNTKQNASKSDWVKVFDSVVGDDLINRHHYAELPFHTVFRFLTQKIKENARS